MRSAWTIAVLCVSLLGRAAQWDLHPGQSIQQAIHHAQTGDILVLHSGTYTEHSILIDKPISLIADGSVTIDGSFKGTIIKVESDSILIKGLRLINVGTSFVKEFAAIHLYRCNHFQIVDNVMEEVFFGCLVEKSHYGQIIGNRISSHAVLEAGSGNGVHLWHSSHMLIQDNELSGLRDGIYFEFVEDSEIVNNHSHHQLRYGLHFMFSNRDTYRNNKFHSNGAGVAVMFSKLIEMTGNEFYDNWGMASYGLLLKEINDAEIHHNQFRKNTVAIQVEGSNRINYTYNRFERNGWAIKVVGACYLNKVQQNDFLHNSFDLSYHSQVNDNAFNSNFWSDYNGYDLNHDRKGDVAYRPVKLFSYIVNKTPETIVLLRSLFVFIINFSEKVSPIFTPDELVDEEPSMRPNT